METAWNSPVEARPGLMHLAAFAAATGLLAVGTAMIVSIQS